MEFTIVLLGKLPKIHMRNEKPKQIHEEMRKRGLTKSTEGSKNMQCPIQ